MLCRVPQAKTYVLRNTNTTFKLLENYLLQLQLACLIDIEPVTKKYLTTKEGQKFIQAWIHINSMIYPQEAFVVNKSKKCVILKS